MSAMPARTPRVAPTVHRPRQTTAKSTHKGRAKKSTLKSVVMPAFAPALETLSDSIPKPPSQRLSYKYALGIFIVFGILLVGIVNTLSASASFEKHDLTIKLSQLTATQQQLEQQVALQESPAHLIVVARKLGMVPAASPAFLRLSDHKILGKPELARKGQ